MGHCSNFGASGLKSAKQAISEGNMADADGFKDVDAEAGEGPIFGSGSV